jgi:hypothetical protein
MTAATIAPTGMTRIEIGSKTEIGIRTGIEMTTETEGTHGETGRDLPTMRVSRRAIISFIRVQY